MMKKLIVKVVIVILSIALILAGIAGGGFRDVKNKAAMICYECIGVG